MACVLLPEPDRAIREFVAGILTEFGHDVLVCDSAIEASGWLAGSRVDVLVTDTVLRDADAVSLSRSCAALGIPTITLTGRAFHADRTDIARLAPLLEKPFRFSDLHRVLHAVDTPRPAPAARRHTSNAA